MRHFFFFMHNHAGERREQASGKFTTAQSASLSSESRCGHSNMEQAIADEHTAIRRAGAHPRGCRRRE